MTPVPDDQGPDGPGLHDGVPGAAHGIRVDALTAADVEACARLEMRLFAGDDPWSASAFRAELAAGHPYLAARAGAEGSGGPAGALVGYAGVALLPSAAFSRDPSEAEVHTVAVDPAVQGRGVGRRLLRGLLGRADAIGAVTFLEVRTDNGAALALYRSEGFEVVGTRRRYYAGGADAHTMRRPAAAGEDRSPPPGNAPGDPR